MKKFLDFFVKVEEQAKSEDVKPIQAIPQASRSLPTDGITTLPSSIGVEDEAIKKELITALEKANLAGYDYFELAKAVDAQASIIPSEALRFQSAFAVATATDSNVTADKLISTAAHYLEVFKGKEDEFTKAMEQHSAAAIQGKEKQITDIDTEMKAKAEQINALTQEINTLQQQKTNMQNELSGAKADVERVKNNFYATMKKFTDRITSDIEKIKTYLGGK